MGEKLKPVIQKTLVEVFNMREAESGLGFRPNEKITAVFVDRNSDRFKVHYYKESSSLAK